MNLLPGTYLFVGGVLDGRRLFLSRPEQYMRMEAPRPLPAVQPPADLDPMATYAVDFRLYRATTVRDGDTGGELVVYLSQDSDARHLGLMRLLIDGYRGQSAPEVV